VSVHDSSAVAQAPGDGAGHNGPGTGGGTGAGAGTGTGSAVGPGTGGSPVATKIRAATDVMTLATIDAPKRPRPFHLHAVFAVDTHGDAALLTVNKADDGDFNREIHARLLETHFKPATRPDGTPVPDTVAIDIDY
jgi:protein TonB